MVMQINIDMTFAHTPSLAAHRLGLGAYSRTPPRGSGTTSLRATCDKGPLLPADEVEYTLFRGSADSVKGSPTYTVPVSLFFEWIKQHLRINAFYGTSENAVNTQMGYSHSRIGLA